MILFLELGTRRQGRTEIAPRSNAQFARSWLLAPNWILGFVLTIVHKGLIAAGKNAVREVTC